MTIEEFKFLALICLTMMVFVSLYCWKMYHIEVKKNELRNQLIYDIYLEIEEELEEGDNYD